MNKSENTNNEIKTLDDETLNMTAKIWELEEQVKNQEKGAGVGPRQAIDIANKMV